MSWRQGHPHTAILWHLWHRWHRWHFLHSSSDGGLFSSGGSGTCWCLVKSRHVKIIVGNFVKVKGGRASSWTIAMWSRWCVLIVGGVVSVCDEHEPIANWFIARSRRYDGTHTIAKNPCFVVHQYVIHRVAMCLKSSNS